MNFFIPAIILFIFSIIIFYLSYQNLQQKQDYNKQLEEQNKNIQNTNNELLNTNKILLKDNEQLLNKKQEIETEIQNLNQMTANMNETSKKAFEQYCDILEDSYQKLEQEYNDNANGMNKAYNELQDQLIKNYFDKKDELDLKITAVQNDLYKISATRAAAIEAINREKEIKEQLDFYCLQISQEDLDDIKVLERIKSKLHQPRILSMLIWSTYYQKPMTQLCNNILGTGIKTGIYKITNQLNNMCYIGQSVDVRKTLERSR